MTKKSDRVPGTTEVKPNREQRRHPKPVDRPQDEQLTRDDADVVVEADVPSVRAKNTGHGKKTADKWNQ